MFNISGKKKKEVEFEYDYEENDIFDVDMAVEDEGKDESFYPLGEKNSEVQELKKVIEETQSEYVAMKSKSVQTEMENQRLQSANEKLKYSLNKKQQDSEQMANRMMDYQQRVKLLEEEASNTKDINKENSKLNQEVSYLKKQITDLHESQGKIEQDLVEENKKLKHDLNKKQQESEQMVNRMMDYQQKVKVLEEKVSSNKDINKENDELKGKILRYENNSDKLEIADVLLEAKGTASQIISRAESEAKRLISQAGEEAHKKATEAEYELLLMQKRMNEFHQNIELVKKNSMNIFEELSHNFSIFSDNI